MHATLEGTAMTQHTINRGLKIFGEDGTHAVLQELKQLHGRKVVEPKTFHDLACKERRDSLRYLMFLKEKRTGIIKGRGCADGRQQRDYLTKEDTSLPIVAIESVLLSYTIDAKERRDVATVDIPGAFMQIDMKDTVHMVLEGTMAGLLVKLDPKLYQKYIQVKKGKPVMYVQLKKALYGTLQASLLFWKDLLANLRKWGFEVKPYNWCVANKTINGKHCTMLWHVDDIKISHEDPEVVSQMIELLKGAYGKEASLTITRGKIHEYLGMTIDYSTLE
jgi:hypothetical protein